jgi:hypothetical protein
MTSYIVQALGLLTLALYAASMHMRRKEALLALQVASNLSFVVACVLNASPTGAAIGVLSTARGVVFYLCARRGMKPSVAVFALFLAAVAASTLCTWEGVFSLFALAATSVSLYSQWQDNMRALRILTMVGNILWMPYHVNAKSYGYLLSEICILTSSATALWKFRNRALPQQEKTP